jgi:D-serine deaminase-like pyridoxal phosphate-dependent protein
VHRLQQALDALVERVDTPAPIVLVDVMQGNIDRMQGFAAQHNLDLRPHVKTHKCVEIGRRQVEAGAVGITAGKCCSKASGTSMTPVMWLRTTS